MLVSQTVKGIKNSQNIPQDVKDPLTQKHLEKMYRKANTKAHMGLLVWTMIIFLFSTLLRVSHVVLSPHTLLRKDIKFFKWGVLVCIRSSKTKKEPFQISISYGRKNSICPVYWLGKMFTRYPRSRNAYLFSTSKVRCISYQIFNAALKSLTLKARLKGNFATHSLRRSGTTTLHQKGAPLPYIRERGQWASDCIYKYIKPSVLSKIKNDKKFSTT